MLAFAQAMSGEIMTQGSVSTSRPKNPEPIKEPVPFKEQEGIKKLIQDYQLIRQGKSKKGQLKQNRIIKKIESYIDNGMLKESDFF